MTKRQIGNAHGDRVYNQTVHMVHVTDMMRLSGNVTAEVLAEAVSFLHRDGILVLENAVDPAHLDTLNDILGPEAEEIARDPTHHFNFGMETRNMDQAPPLVPELMFTDIWANPVAVTILSALLGPNPVCHYANGNTALKSRGRQPVHKDIDRPHPLYPFAYAINIPLCDTDVENGSTEVWVGSHRGSTIDDHAALAPGEYALSIKPESLFERERHSPPVQPRTQKGSLILRDLRLWHAGMPNWTDQPRIMLSFVVQPWWFSAPSKVLLPRKAQALVAQWKAETGLEYAAQWVDGEVDHKKVNSEEVDFSTRNKRLLELETMTHLPLH